VKITKQLIKKRIQTIYEKAVKKGIAFRTVQESVTYYSLNLHANQLAKLIEQTILDKTFQPSPLTPKIIYNKTKERIIYPLTAIDNIVQGVLYEILLKLALPKISQQVHSYIPGRGTRTAINQFTDYIKKINQSDSKKDIFVFRTDIRKYTDSIPLHSNSYVWQQMNELINKTSFDEKMKPAIMALAQAFIRPSIKLQNELENGGTYQSLVGLPTGIPLTTIVANLYLADLDHALEALPNILYLRYGDDILIAHEDPQVILQAEKIYVQHLEKLKLIRHPEKDQRIYFTRAGKAHTDTLWTGAQSIDYIGFSVNRFGHKSISMSRRHRLKIMLKERIRTTYALIKHFDRSVQIGVLSTTVANLLHSSKELVLSEADALLEHTDDRSALKQFDYFVAYEISKTITGIHGPRTFRHVSIKQIRQYLPAFVFLKN
jgi:retron-type reverse transcriptase